MKFVERAQFITAEEREVIFALGHDLSLRISLLEEGIFRVSLNHAAQFKFPRTWAIAWGDVDVPMVGRDRNTLNEFSFPKMRVEQEQNAWRISSETSSKSFGQNYSVLVHCQPFYLQWFGGGEPVFAERKTGSLAVRLRGDGFQHFHDLPADVAIYGLGEKSGELNRRGRRFTMRNVDAMGYDAEKTDPLYKHIPFYIYRPQNEKATSVGVFYDNSAHSSFDFGCEIDNYHAPFMSFRAEAGDLDYYVMFGEQVSEVVTKMTRLTGRPMLAPKWSLSYSGSTMTYTDQANAQEALLGFLTKLQEYKIPCRSFHLSSGYTSIGQRRYVFNWNRDKIPDPMMLVREFREHDVRLVPNIKPVMLDDHPLYAEAKQKKLFVRDSETDLPEQSPFWDGVGSHLDFTNRDAVQFWIAQIKSKLIHYGIDTVWNDNNEFSISDDEARFRGDGFAEWPAKYGRAIQTLLMLKASRQALLEANSEARPFQVSRAGLPGMQRYVQTWSGDNRTEWKTLKYNHFMALSLSMSGVSNTGHDIGGFAGPKPEPELFLRWIQHGILLPRFVIHSWKAGEVNEPWMYPEIMALVRDAFLLRERLLPYLYQVMRSLHHEFAPAIRPIFYDFESDPRAFEANEQFMLGDRLLIANVLEKNVTQMKIYLPHYKHGWFDLQSGEWFAGGQEIVRAIDLSSIPVYVRGHSLLPLRGEDGRTHLVVYLSPSEEEFEFSYFDDDGISREVTANNQMCLVVKAAQLAQADVHQRERRLRVKLDRTGDFLPENRDLELTFVTSASSEKLVIDAIGGTHLNSSKPQASIFESIYAGATPLEAAPRFLNAISFKIKLSEINNDQRNH